MINFVDAMTAYKKFPDNYIIDGTSMVEANGFLVAVNKKLGSIVWDKNSMSWLKIITFDMEKKVVNKS